MKVTETSDGHNTNGKKPTNGAGKKPPPYVPPEISKAHNKAKVKKENAKAVLLTHEEFTAMMNSGNVVRAKRRTSGHVGWRFRQKNLFALAGWRSG